MRLAVGPSGKAPLAAEMEIRVLGIADRPPAVMLLEGGYHLVLLLLGHDTLFLHAHGARQDCLLQVGSYIIWERSVCITICTPPTAVHASGTERERRNENVPQNSSRQLLAVHKE